MKSLLVACLVVSAVASPAGAKEAPLDWPDVLVWRRPFVGVESTDVVLTQPRPLRLHAVRVDLNAEGVSVCTDDDNGDRPEETDGLRTSSFLTQKGCQVAINGAPFWPGRKDEGMPQNVVGLVVSNGVLVSPVDAEPARAALVFRSGVASIESPPIVLEGVDTAVGGFGVVLRGGEPVRDETSPPDVLDGRHPRSAIGLADEGRTLLLVAVDGRQEGYSEGVDLAELGTLLSRLGADDGLNLDGGGTTTLVMADSAGQARQVNRPIDGGNPGQERVSASHLGVFADPLP